MLPHSVLKVYAPRLQKPISIIAHFSEMKWWDFSTFLLALIQFFKQAFIPTAKTGLTAEHFNF